jgi:hypothetical protein
MRVRVTIASSFEAMGSLFCELLAFETYQREEVTYINYRHKPSDPWLATSQSLPSTNVHHSLDECDSCEPSFTAAPIQVSCDTCLDLVNELSGFGRAAVDLARRLRQCFLAV